MLSLWGMVWRKYIAIRYALPYLALLVLLLSFPHSVLADPALDETANGLFSSASSGSVTLSTINPNDIIVVAVFDENVSSPSRTVSSVTASGLTFAKRSSITGTGPGQFATTWDDMEVWWALASSPLSNEVITVNLSGSIDDASIAAFGVVGANTSSPWDSASPTTNYNTSSSPQPGTITISTNNAGTRDLLLGIIGAEIDALQTGPGDFGSTPAFLIGHIANGGGTDLSYVGVEGLVASTQSSAAISWPASWNGTITSSYQIGDFIQGAASSCATLSAGVNFITNAGLTCLTVPSNWNSASNSIEVIGGGGGGADVNANTHEGGGGGGGGQYAKISDLALTPEGTVTFALGEGGADGGFNGIGLAATGTDTYFNGSSCAGASVCGEAGAGGSSATGDAGGSGGSTGGVGTTYNGGAGGGSTGEEGAGGGGGAGGPLGAGADGGAAANTGSSGGGGGGGNGGGTTGGTSSSANSNGAAGGNNASSSGSGTGGTRVLQTELQVPTVVVAAEVMAGGLRHWG